MLDYGARILRHDNTRESALKIVQEIINSHPNALRIQTEYVLTKNDITQTDVRAGIDKWISEFKRERQEGMDKFKGEFHRAMKARGEEEKKKIEEIKQTFDVKINEVEGHNVRLSQRYKEEKEMATKMIKKLRIELDEHLEQSQERHDELERAQKARRECLERLVRKNGSDAKRNFQDNPSADLLVPAAVLGVGRLCRVSAIPPSIFPAHRVFTSKVCESVCDRDENVAYCKQTCCKVAYFTSIFFEGFPIQSSAEVDSSWPQTLATVLSTSIQQRHELLPRNVTFLEYMQRVSPSQCYHMRNTHLAAARSLIV